MPKGVYDRSKSRRPNRRDDILKAAAKVYGFYGFEGATIEKMAAEAGVSKSLILELFGSKQELVKEIASRSVSEVLGKVREIGKTPGVTLRRREELIHKIIVPAREEWCLVLGTLLVPSFQFPMRGEMMNYMNENHQIVMSHLHELRDPTPQNAFTFSYSTVSLHVTYILGGREESYHAAMERQLDLYLLPEEEILGQK